jgi:hypothetical protein
MVIWWVDDLYLVYKNSEMVILLGDMIGGDCPTQQAGEDRKSRSNDGGENQ